MRITTLVYKKIIFAKLIHVYLIFVGKLCILILVKDLLRSGGSFLVYGNITTACHCSTRPAKYLCITTSAHHALGCWISFQLWDVGYLSSLDIVFSSTSTR